MTDNELKCECAAEGCHCEGIADSPELIALDINVCACCYADCPDVHNNAMTFEEKIKSGVIRAPKGSLKDLPAPAKGKPMTAELLKMRDEERY